MKYDKGPLSFEAQAERLISRGLLVDKELLIPIIYFPVKAGYSSAEIVQKLSESGIKS